MDANANCVVLYRNDEGVVVSERGLTPAQASARLNELWGTCGSCGPQEHREALATFDTWQPRRAKKT